MALLCHQYESCINETNKLGTGGELARAFGALIKTMWSGKHAAVRPTLPRRRNNETSLLNIH